VYRIVWYSQPLLILTERRGLFFNQQTAEGSAMRKVYVLHENDNEAFQLTRHLEELNIPYEVWNINEDSIDLGEEPPEGIFYSWISADSLTRGSRFTPEFTGAVLQWLEGKDRKVINGSSALRFEISKAAQYAALNRDGIRLPQTIVASGKDEIIHAAQKLNKSSFLIKHSRGGNGRGVLRFHSIEALKDYVYSSDFEEPLDGITLIQEYIEASDQSITRCEFIGGKFLYAVKVHTADSKQGHRIIKDFHETIIQKYENFLQQQQIHVAGIEFLKDKDGKIYTYAINTTANYFSEAEREANIYGMKELANYLKKELEIPYLYHPYALSN
jgi:glutathione synthase/RimK-type ligase-like ATP-grasp enzyme